MIYRRSPSSCATPTKTRITSPRAPFPASIRKGRSAGTWGSSVNRSEEHTSELQSQSNLVCRLLLEKKKKQKIRLVEQKPPLADVHEVKFTLFAAAHAIRSLSTDTTSPAYAASHRATPPVVRVIRH